MARRDRILISSCLILLTALAWAYLLLLDRRMSAATEYDAAMAAMGMTSGASWGVVDVWLTFVMWLVMMVGMMTGSAAPVFLLYARTAASRSERRVPFSVLTFGLGYFVAWAAFSVCAALGQWGLHQAAMLSPAMRASSPRLAGGLLLVAGAYQLTPLKNACLAHCRSPLGFLMTGWRDGAAGAFRMGGRHGLYCLGCCWATMTILFAVGVMNLLWVAMLAGFVLLEKTGPGGVIVARVAGAMMLIAGIVVIVRA